MHRHVASTVSLTAPHPPPRRQFFSHWLPSIPDLSFVIFEHLLLGLKFLIHKVIHERPRWVRIGLLKADFETSQALKQLK